LQLPQTTANYRQLPPIAILHLFSFILIRTTVNYRKLPRTTANYRQLPPTTVNYRKLPQTTANYRQLLQNASLHLFSFILIWTLFKFSVSQSKKISYFQNKKVKVKYLLKYLKGTFRN